MEGSEKFCLRWNDFETNISEGFRELREEKDFFDVTLACEDNQIQAHRVIISACSSFFKTVLRRNPHPHPLLYLKGVKYRELLSILNFMYVGEVNVAQEELNSFLTVAEDLKVKGLTQNNPDCSPSQPEERKDQQKAVKKQVTIPEPPPHPLPHQIKKQPSSALQHNTTARPSYGKKYQEAGIEEVAVIKTEILEPQVQQSNFPNSTTVRQAEHLGDECASVTVADTENYEVDETYDDYHYDATYPTMIGAGAGTVNNSDPIAAREEEIMSLILKDVDRKMFTCAVCQFGASSRHKAFCHIESKHFQDSPVTYTCPFCGKTAQTKNAIGLHISRNHKHERGDSKNSLFPKENFLF